jgi:hypothetical protein
MRSWGLAVLSAALVGRLEGQTEGELRRFFEGKTIVALLDMPGAEDGVDVWPGTSMPIDFPRHAARLKRFGTAIRRGEQALITKIRVKKDLIEFQLGGGGYGTFWDDASPDVPVPSVPRSEREKNLEADLKKVTDPAERRKIREELDALRRDREREEGRLRTDAEQAKQLKEANIRQRRLEGGSRFNLRYRPLVPEGELTPDAVMRALNEYVDFGPLLAGTGAQPGPAPAGGLRKGLLEAEVDALYGRPDTITRRQEGSLGVSVAVYLTSTSRIEAEFVEGVLIRFRITER